jgi:tetratricopeptide (TPR) repeat protein
MNARAEALALADVPRVLDYYLAAQRRQKQAAPPSAAARYNPNAGQPYFVYVGTRNPRVEIDYPVPNGYFDFGGLNLLREAFELYQRADLLTDLLGQLRDEEARAAPAEKVYPRLALAYLQWWAGERDQAVRELKTAAALVPDDVELRLELADVHERLGQRDEALAVIDGFTPLDHATMLRRETMALRLASLTGNVDRARQAADRLFGLRLDAELQVQLAAQMQQLGMHDAAEAVLGRAQRQAGGRSGALVALMFQYQNQNRPELAVQVALQVLRRGPSLQFGPRYYGGGGNEDYDREQAVNVLQRSGKLKELIERAEAQLKNAPRSLQLHQVLVEYYKVDGQRDKAKEMQNRLVALRPDDAKLRFHVANELARSGDHKEACDHYLAALKKEPSLYSYNYWEVYQTFEQAGRFADLAKLFDEIDVRQVGYSWSVMEIVQELTRDEKTETQGLRLFRKAWQAYPDERAYMLSNLYDERVWRMPELYDFVREGIIPRETDTRIDAWAGLDQIISWDGNGRVTTVLSRLLDTAARQNKVEALTREVEAGLKQLPEWSGGKVLLAALQLRRGKPDEARKLVLGLLEDKKDPMPMTPRWVLAQELDGYAAQQDLAFRLLEGAVEEALKDQQSYEFTSSPAQRLVTLYLRAGRKDEARALLLRYARADFGYDYDPGYSAYRRVSGQSGVAGELLAAGFPVDALRIYDPLLRDHESLDLAAMRYGEQMGPVVEQGLTASVKAVKGDNLPGSLRDLLTARPDAKAGVPALDPLVVLPGRDSSKGVACTLAVVLKLALADDALKAEVKTRLADLLKDHPNDLSVQLAATLAAAYDGKGENLAKELDRLVRVMDETPLEEIPAGGKANARQRAQALQQLGLWVVARECYGKDALRDQAVKLAGRAVEAATRQKEPVYALSILREWGQLDLDRGDRKGAEERWGRMLELVLPPKKERTDGAAPALPGGLQPVKAPAKEQPAAVPAVTLDQFTAAMEVARLAAEKGMPALSLRGVREALRGGPPVIPTVGGGQSRGAPSGVAPEDQSSIFAVVEATLAELDTRWREKGVPAADVCATLAAVVLPEARPNEVFLYPGTVSYADPQQQRSVGRMLAGWAAKAGKGDDVRKAIDARQAQTLAELPARVLLAQLGMAGKDARMTAEALDWLAARLQKDKLQNTADLACHAALPALDTPDVAKVAYAVVERAAKNLTGQNGNDNGTLLLTLARYQLERKQVEEGKKLLGEFRTQLLRTALRNGGNLAQLDQFQAMAREFLRAGLVPDTLDLFGQYIDALEVFKLDEPPQTPGINALGTSFTRQFSGLPAKERYALMKEWSLPDELRRSVRLNAGFGPAEVPPEAFGKFPAPADGVLGSPVALIDAARDAGKLDELAADVEAAVRAKAKNAEELLALVQLARGNDDAVEPLVKKILDDYAKPEPPPQPSRYGRGDAPKPVSWAHFLIARGCLARPKLRATGEKLAGVLLKKAQGVQDTRKILQLHHDLAAATAGRAGGKPDAGPGLALWHPASDASADTHQWGTVGPWWAAHEGHVSHLVGPQNDYLFFDYPLTGTYEFSVEAYHGAWAEGAVACQGLVFEPFWMGGTPEVEAVGGHNVTSVAFGYARADDFNKITVKVEPGRLRCYVNGYLFHDEKDPSPTSPWLGLYTHRERVTTWRNFTLTGKPEIPREVPLTHGDRLEGWGAGFYHESVPVRHPVETPDPSQFARGRYRGDRYPGAGEDTPPEPNWSAKDGVILGQRSDSYVPGGPTQSRLCYQRPLRNGDTLAYEFWYESGRVHVHPALDRLTFLLEPAGVRVHWITDGPDVEWTGLAADNAADEPANRRGPAQLPLREKDWNAVKLTLRDDTLSLELNGVEVYQRKLEPTNDRRFSLFHYSDRTAVKVRKAVLKGDWPQALTAEQLKDLVAPAAGGADARAQAALVGERFLSMNAGTVLEKARTLPPAQRYAYLLGWVLPKDGEVGVRLAADFTPFDPAPPVTDRKVDLSRLKPRSHVGGTLEAPALELVATAKGLQKLDELAQAVQKTPAETDAAKRGQAALLAVIRAAQGRDDDADGLLRGLLPELRKLDNAEPAWVRWPELVAAAATMEKPRLRPAAKALLDHVVVEQIQKANKDHPLAPGWQWDQRVRNLRARAQLLSLPEGRNVTFGSDPGLAYWAPVLHDTADSRGEGRPQAQWLLSDVKLTHYPGHTQDYLYFGVPLRGEFEVECELTSFGWREIQPVYSCLGIGAQHELNKIYFHQVGRDPGAGATRPIEPPLPRPGEWYKYRLVVKDGGYEVYLNGQKVYEQSLPPDADPWLALRCQQPWNGGMRDLKVKGNPTIPDSLDLTAAADLAPWSAQYYNESAGGENATWQKRGEEIYAAGGLPPDAPDYRPQAQSVLQYHRPMLEDGEVEYEFWYEPGKVEVAPALDRLALLLTADGVKVHWLTDAAHERSGLAPDNEAVEKDNRRGPDRLPLKAKEWNKVKLAVAGDRVKLTLNGVEVYERPLEATNQRTFGLFHYTDATEVRVRQVTYRGQWPKTLPAEDDLLNKGK